MKAFGWASLLREWAALAVIVGGVAALSVIRLVPSIRAWMDCHPDEPCMPPPGGELRRV